MLICTSAAYHLRKTPTEHDMWQKLQDKLISHRLRNRNLQDTYEIRRSLIQEAMTIEEMQAILPQCTTEQLKNAKHLAGSSMMQYGYNFVTDR